MGAASHTRQGFLIGVASVALVLGACGHRSSPPDSASWRPAPSATATPSDHASGPSQPSSSGQSSSQQPSPIVVPSGVSVGFAVFDRSTGSFTAQRQATQRFRSASLVKLLIALDYLWERGPGYSVATADRGRFDLMLRSSDDNAASYFYQSDGREQSVRRMITRLGLANTAAPPTGRGWGTAAFSAIDVVRIYRYVLDEAPTPVRELVMGDLHQSTHCGTDHYDQSFGIPSAFGRPWAAKQGWYGFGDTPATPCTATAGWTPGSPNGLGAPRVLPALASAPDVDVPGVVLHTTGTVGAGDRVIVAVLTRFPVGTPFDRAASQVTGLTRSLPVPGV